MTQSAGKRDYPASEFLTSPLGKGLGSAATTGGIMLALRRGLRSGALGRLSKKALESGLVGSTSGPTNKSIGFSSALSGALSGLMANYEGDIYARALRRKLESGRGGFTSQEKKLLVGDRGKGTGKVKGFSEYYVTPRTHGLGRAALGLLFGGPSGAVAEGLSAGVGTAANRHLWARSLVSRAKRGELTSEEGRLLHRIRLGG